MIKYARFCENSHEFEGGFPDSAGFEAQLADNLVSCPHCASLSVRRALMAPALSSPKTRARSKPRPPAPQADQLIALATPQPASQMMGGKGAGNIVAMSSTNRARCCKCCRNASGGAG